VLHATQLIGLYYFIMSVIMHFYNVSQQKTSLGLSVML